MKLNRKKVNEILRTCKPGTVYTERWVCVIHDISHQSFVRRCKVDGWTREQLIALGATLGKLRGTAPLDVEEICDGG